MVKLAAVRFSQKIWEQLRTSIPSDRFPTYVPLQSPHTYYLLLRLQFHLYSRTIDADLLMQPNGTKDEIMHLYKATACNSSWSTIFEIQFFHSHAVATGPIFFKNTYGHLASNYTEETKRILVDGQVFPFLPTVVSTSHMIRHSVQGTRHNWRLPLTFPWRECLEHPINPYSPGVEENGPVHARDKFIEILFV